MALVFAILCHASPRALADLVRALHHPEHAILLHADAKAPPALHAAARALAAALPNVHVVAPVPCAWGGWSLVEGSLRCLDDALALPTPWRHFCLLSEQHMPLQPPSVIAANLPAGVSFSDAVPPPAMDADQRADLLYRFSRRWRELPGVGMFALGPRALTPGQIAGLRRGSQWVVLARAACERLASVRDDPALWAPFRESLVPDETALMSVLRGTGLGAGLEVRLTNPTFVAWPHLGGGPDSVFTDETVRGARARGHLFIRKRPPHLPPYAAALLAAMPGRPHLPAFPPPDPPADDPRASTLAEALRAGLRRVAVSAAPHGTGPACCLEFRAPGQAEALSVHLLSQDFATFKLLLAWRRPFDGALTPIDLGGHTATILGARLPGLALAREVHLLDIPDFGFLRGDADALAPHVATALAVARHLSPLLPA